MRHWQLSNETDPAIARAADRHYSRKTRGHRRFMPPGYKIVLYIQAPTWPFEVAAAWGWWRPPTPKRMDGYDGWYNCSLFRNESSGILSSVLILEAVEWANEIWGLPEHGYDTYVWPEKLQSSNPGYCYLKAGWRRSHGQWSKDGKKRRLYLPVAQRK